MITVILLIIGVAVIIRAGYIMFAQKDYWEAVSERFVKENVTIYPTRGNIISADGQLMASSLPEYKIYMDFIAGDKDPEKKAKVQALRDSLLQVKMDSICDGLHRIFPDKSASYFRERLKEGRKKEKRSWLIYPRRISYIKYKQVKRLPLFNLSPYKGGFHVAEFNQRKKPFGSLASRTLGDLYGAIDTARCGLELAFDTILRGKPGRTHRQKVMNKYLNVIDVPPVDGMDIETTIDVNMQDICEKALVDKLKEINARVGVAILMEVATGDVKAIVNMTQCSDGEFREIRNNAVSDLLEPGSVFKPVSFMVAFDDEKIKMTDSINVGCGILEMHGRLMKDHNWRRGGYQRISVPQALGYSSNIGVSYLIDKNYFNNPEKFVDGIYRTGIATDLKLPIPGYARPRIRRPKKDGSNWSKTALAWMSIGYETQVPPISTLTFYNGVANGGKVMKPRFVKSIMKNGEVIREYPMEVVRERMCSPKALQEIQACLEGVVSKGLGKQAGSKNFKVSGKTGTAQIWTKAGFASQYLVSFAGYFPSEAPLYSCIVCIQKGLPASGGGQCGPVFKRIAEAVMAGHLRPDIASVKDTVGLLVPYVKKGNLNAAKNVLSSLNISHHVSAGQTSSDMLYGQVISEKNGLQMEKEDMRTHIVPDATGMGARDAVFLMERNGLRATVKGVGKVTKQSIPSGTPIVKGKTIMLTLETETKAALRPVSVPTPVRSAASSSEDSAKNKRPVVEKTSLKKKETTEKTKKQSAEKNTSDKKTNTSNHKKERQ